MPFSLLDEVVNGGSRSTPFSTPFSTESSPSVQSSLPTKNYVVILSAVVSPSQRAEVRVFQFLKHSRELLLTDHDVWTFSDDFNSFNLANVFM